MSAIKKNNNRIICMFRMDLSCKEVVITITRVEKCYKLTRVIDTDVYEQYYPRFSQSYSVMMKMIEDLKSYYEKLVEELEGEENVTKGAE